jgi:hypothetical protein
LASKEESEGGEVGREEKMEEEEDQKRAKHKLPWWCNS